jgi:hypothetical protein
MSFAWSTIAGKLRQLSDTDANALDGHRGDRVFEFGPNRDLAVDRLDPIGILERVLRVFFARERDQFGSRSDCVTPCRTIDVSTGSSSGLTSLTMTSPAARSTVVETLIEAGWVT